MFIKNCRFYKKTVGLTLTLILVYIYFFHWFNFERKPLIKVIQPGDLGVGAPKIPEGYLVYGPRCHIPNYDPYSEVVINYIHPESQMPCQQDPLTSIQMNYDKNLAVLVVNQTLRSKYLHWWQNELKCYYQNIVRSGGIETADDEFVLSDRKYFKETIELPLTDQNILVKCEGTILNSYTNAHATIRKTDIIHRKLNKFKKPDIHRPVSVLMLGIDSISRLNLIRTMPKTTQHLYDTGWFDLRGYNKVEDNTFPNLVSILLGYDYPTVQSKCVPEQSGGLDECPFMWKYFSNSGYVTAYAEDEIEMNTFNYYRKGFRRPPTDHYFRPFGLAAEQNLWIKKKAWSKYCMGYKRYAEHVYDYALDFATMYKNDTSFGLFWTSSFSHNDINTPSTMDDTMKHYLKQLESRGILSSSIVVFFSDHGIRFGSVRELPTGWFEDRLPFIFIWLPPVFRQQHPDFVRNLQINRDRLTNPYDLHLTLKHILELSGRSAAMPGALSCPTCQSLFHEVPLNRSCDEVGIPAHYCTCASYDAVDVRSLAAVEATAFAMQHMNKLLDNMKKGSAQLCKKLTLKSVLSAKQKQRKQVNDILVTFETTPGNGRFDTTVRYYYEEENRYEITGTINRVNAYGSEGKCVEDAIMRLYCVCL